ncbi:MAG: S24 family peptidase [Pseudomonadales bacterium]|jgi:phage repressor protein C with HTH and peptisase S24 domain|tara:strand:+ start:1234 stop:1587 length:354 start_codon:yes stop_codon:yes gene_type:complete
MLKMFRVEGDSMTPLFASGDLVGTFNSRAKIGNVVVMDLPNYGYVLKRLEQVRKKEVMLCSDNKEIFSSCCGVWQSKNHLIGKVLFKINLNSKASIKLEHSLQKLSGIGKKITSKLC